MSKVRKVDFSPDEFIAGTVGMTPEEVGVYWLVCSLIYSSGTAIPQDDERLRALRCDPRTTRAVIASLVRKGKIEVGPGDEMIVRRCRDELERSSTRMRQAAESGATGGRPKKPIEENQTVTKPEAFSTEKLSPSSPPSPSISKEESISRDSAGVIPFPSSEDRHPTLPLEPVATSKGQTSKPKAPEPDGFREWYDAFPVHKAPAKAAKAYGAAIRNGADPATLLAAARRYAVEQRGNDPRWIKHPTTWLNGECWNDEPTTDAQRKETKNPWVA